MKNYIYGSRLAILACLFICIGLIGMAPQQQDEHLEAYLNSFITPERVNNAPLKPEDQASILEAREAALQTIAATPDPLRDDEGYQDNLRKILNFFELLERHLEESTDTATLLANTEQDIKTLQGYKEVAKGLNIKLAKIRDKDDDTLDTLRTSFGVDFAGQITEGTQRLSKGIRRNLSQLMGRTKTDEQRTRTQNLTKNAKEVGIKKIKKQKATSLETEHIEGIANNLYEIIQAQAAIEEFPNAQVRLGTTVTIRLNKEEHQDLIEYAENNKIGNANEDGNHDFIVAQEFDVVITHENGSIEIRECKNTNKLPKHIKKVSQQEHVLKILNKLHAKNNLNDNITVKHGSLEDLIGARVILQAPELSDDQTIRGRTLSRLARANGQLNVGDHTNRGVHIGHDSTRKRKRPGTETDSDTRTDSDEDEDQPRASFRSPKKHSTPKRARTLRALAQGDTAGTTIAEISFNPIISGSTTRATEILETLAQEGVPLGRITPQPLAMYFDAMRTKPGSASPALQMLLSGTATTPASTTTTTTTSIRTTPVDLNFLVEMERVEIENASKGDKKTYFMKPRETTPGFEALLLRSATPTPARASRSSSTRSNTSLFSPPPTPPVFSARPPMQLTSAPPPPSNPYTEDETDVIGMHIE